MNRLIGAFRVLLGLSVAAPKHAVPVKLVEPVVIRTVEALPAAPEVAAPRASSSKAAAAPAPATLGEKTVDDARRTRQELEKAADANGLAKAVEAEMRSGASGGAGGTGRRRTKRKTPSKP